MGKLYDKYKMIEVHSKLAAHPKYIDCPQCGLKSYVCEAKDLNDIASIFFLRYDPIQLDVLKFEELYQDEVLKDLEQIIEETKQKKISQILNAYLFKLDKDIMSYESINRLYELPYNKYTDRILKTIHPILLALNKPPSYIPTPEQFEEMINPTLDFHRDHELTIGINEKPWIMDNFGIKVFEEYIERSSIKVLVNLYSFIPKIYHPSSFKLLWKIKKKFYILRDKLQSYLFRNGLASNLVLFRNYPLPMTNETNEYITEEEERELLNIFKQNLSAKDLGRFKKFFRYSLWNEIPKE